MSPRRLLVVSIMGILAAFAIVPVAQPETAVVPGPGWIDVTGVDPFQAQVDFDSVWPRDYYVAYLYDAGGAPLRRERSNGPVGNMSAHTWNGLTPCTGYSTAAAAVVSGAETAPSKRVAFSTPGCLPGPGWIKPLRIADTEADLDFDSVWPRDHYLAYLFDDRGVELRRDQSNGAVGNTSAHTERGLAPCRTYKAAASAVVSGVETAPTPRISFRTTGCWGGFANPAALPGAGWRPYSPTSAWNRGTAGAVVRSGSAAMVDYLRRTADGAMHNIAVPDDTGSTPVYFADSDDPQYTIHCRLWTGSCEIEGATVRIPKGALPTRAFDRHLVSIQPDGTEIDLWEADDPSGSGGPLSVSHGGATRIDGDSTGSNAVAAMTGAMAGQFTTASWKADRINHALQLIIPRDSGQYVYPAGKTGASDPASSPIPMGQWFKLNITDAELAVEPPWRRAIYRAMRDYGLFVVDTGSSFMIGHENPLTYTAFGATDPAQAWLRGQTDVDQWTDPTTGILNAVAHTPSFPFEKLVALQPPSNP
jgi:hypothetical protein